MLRSSTAPPGTCPQLNRNLVEPRAGRSRGLPVPDQMQPCIAAATFKDLIKTFCSRYSPDMGILAEIRRFVERRRWIGSPMTRALLIAALFLLLPALAAAEGSRPAQPPVPAEATPFELAEASCASLCRQRHNQCRISTRGSARCDADLQRCLKGCLATQRR